MSDHKGKTFIHALYAIDEYESLIENVRTGANTHLSVFIGQNETNLKD